MCAEVNQHLAVLFREQCLQKVAHGRMNRIPVGKPSIKPIRLSCFLFKWICLAGLFDGTAEGNDVIPIDSGFLVL